MLLELGFLALALVARGPADPPDGEAAVYGVLPMRYLAGSRESAEGLVGIVQSALEARGARFVPSSVLEDALRAHRIRQTDSVSPEDADAIRQDTGIRFLITGTLLEYAGAPRPRIALVLHLVDTTTGRRALSSLVSLRGEDFAGLLGLGEIREEEPLALEVAARILGDFDASGWPVAPARPRLADFRPGDALSSFRRRDFDPSRADRLAVMPLVNRTNRLEAGRVFGDVLAHQWFRSAGVDVVESSELRSVLVRLGVRSLDSLDEELFRRIGLELGARYFLLGSLDRFEVGTYREGGFSPEVEASARLLDVVEARIVAAASVRRRGDDYHVVLGLGNVNDLTTLADRTAREMVALMGVTE